MLTREPLVPSEDIDKIWHFHQACSANYRDFTS